MFTAVRGGFNYLISVFTGSWLNISNSGSYAAIVADPAQTSVTISGAQYSANYLTTGSTSWQKQSTNTTFAVDDMVVDVDGNIYIVGADTVSTSTNMYLYKLDPSGSLLWQRDIGTNAGADVGYSIALDSTSSNVYVAGAYGNGTLLAKYTNIGILSNTYQLVSTAGSFISGIQLDSSGNIYLATHSTSTASYLSKFNSSNVHQWTVAITTPSGSLTRQIKLDSSNNIYLVIDNGGTTMTLFKYNSSGARQWYVGASTSLSIVGNYGGKFDVDSSGNTYITAYRSSGAGTNATWLGKIDTTGALVWGRSFIGSTNNFIYGVQLQGSYMLVSSFSNANSSTYNLWRLPTDGTLTGTYQGITYGSSSRTLVTSPSGFTFSTTTLSLTTISVTSSTPSFTISNSSFTNSLTNI